MRFVVSEEVNFLNVKFINVVFKVKFAFYRIFVFTATEVFFDINCWVDLGTFKWPTTVQSRKILFRWEAPSSKWLSQHVKKLRCFLLFLNCMYHCFWTSKLERPVYTVYSHLVPKVLFFPSPVGERTWERGWFLLTSFYVPLTNNTTSFKCEQKKAALCIILHRKPQICAEAAFLFFNLICQSIQNFNISRANSGHLTITCARAVGNLTFSWVAGRDGVGVNLNRQMRKKDVCSTFCRLRPL